VVPALAKPPSGVTTTVFAVGRFSDIDAKTKTDINPNDPTDFWQARINTKGASVTAGSGFVDQGHDVRVVRNEGSVDLVTVVVSLEPALLA